MKTVTFELPDESAKIMNELSKAEKDKLSSYLQLRLFSLKESDDSTLLDVVRDIQKHVSSQNLSEKEIDDLINDSIT